MTDLFLISVRVKMQTFDLNELGHNASVLIILLP